MTSPVETENELTTDWLSISLDTPLSIRARSYGQIRTSNLFNAELGRFHHDGLFSERIFGPLANFRCACGKYSGTIHFGVVCEDCGVQIRSNTVRSERMAHIELPLPILHPWFCGHDLAPVELLLGMSHLQLRRLVTRRSFIPLASVGPQLLSMLRSRAAAQTEGDLSLDGFLDRSGANAVRTLLQRFDFVKLLHFLEVLYGIPPHELFRPESRQLPLVDPAMVAEIARQTGHFPQRMELLRSVASQQLPPQGMVLDVIPVLPARLRTIWLAADGQIEVDRVTARYQRIVRWCGAIERSLSRLQLRGNKWPEGEVVRRLAWRERRLAAEVSGLFNDILLRRPESLCEFPDRFDLVPDPTLPLYGSRLPLKRASEMFSGSLLSHLFPEAVVERSVLESEVAKHPLVVNLAATNEPAELVSLQPRLAEDRALHVHPLLAATFNRSTSGPQARIHVPRWMESEMDCDRFSFPSAALRDPISGKCRIYPAIDAAVGIYLATWLAEDRQKLRDQAIAGELAPRGMIPTFACLDDVVIAWENGRLQLQDLVAINLANCAPLFRSVIDRQDLRDGKQRAGTTVGRAIMNSFLPPEFPYFDVLFDPAAVRSILQDLVEQQGLLAAEKFVERATRFGLDSLTRSGLSLSQSDLLPPQKFASIVEKANKTIARMYRLEERGIICPTEGMSQIYDAALEARNESERVQLEGLQANGGTLHPLFAILVSIGKVPKEQLVKPFGLIGNAWTPWTRRYPVPILGNINQGVRAHEYFQLAAINRHQQILKVHEPVAPRRLQRRIASAIGDVVISEEDCGTREGIEFNRRTDADDDKTRLAFANKICGRVILHALYRMNRTGEEGVIVRANQVLSVDAAQTIDLMGISHLKVRSPLCCRARHGICRKCYGADPATGQLADLGTAVGIKSALAIGPSLRALHELLQPPPFDSLFDGFADPARGFVEAHHEGVVSLRRLRVAVDGDGQRIVVSPSGLIEIIADNGVVDTEWVAHGAVVHVAAGAPVQPNTLLASWDRHCESVFAQDSGTVQLHNLPANHDYRFLTIVDSAGSRVDGCFLPADANLFVGDGDRVEIGALLAQFDRPREPVPASPANHFQQLEHLLEVASPPGSALLSEVDGRVELCIDGNTSCCEILVHPAQGSEPTRYRVPLGTGTSIIARTGQVVTASDPLTRGPISLGDVVRARGLTFVQGRLLSAIRGLMAELKKDRLADQRPWELMVARMLQFVRIESSGDTHLEVGQVKLRGEVMSTNDALAGCVKIADVHAYPVALESNLITREAYVDAERQRSLANPGTPPPGVSQPWPAGWSSMLLGIDELASRGGFLSSGGLRPSRAALVRAVIDGRNEQLERLQESVVAGNLMPAGSGWLPND